MNIEERANNLDKHIANNTLLRKDWGDGYERACLLAALAPECAVTQNPNMCPVDVMPIWLAYLTPYIDDYGSEAVWPDMVRRFARLSHRWSVLTPETWERIKWRWLGESVLALALKRLSVYNGVCDNMIRSVQLLCAQEANGDLLSEHSWSLANRDALEAIELAQENVGLNIRDMTWHAAAAACDVTLVALNQNQEMDGDYCVAAMLQASHAVDDLKVAWDYMTTYLFNLIEAECVKAEACL